MSLAKFPRVSESRELHSRAQILSLPSPVPNQAGVYAWYFRELPAEFDATGCYQIDGLTLLYVGISPKKPPSNGRAPSRSTLRKRLRTHFRGDASRSTLRKTLGCLLAAKLDFQLRLGSGERQTFAKSGEQALNAWMDENAFVVWQAVEKPWEIEQQILQSGLPLPLNIAGNPCKAHTDFMKKVRKDAVDMARQLPTVAG